jgi:hypothetical protein
MFGSAAAREAICRADGLKPAFEKADRLLLRRRSEVEAVSQRFDTNGRTIWIADAHPDDGKHYVVRADEKLTAFLELEAAIPICSEFS